MSPRYPQNTSRRAGGQPGNQNARKHGLHSLQDPAYTADPLLDFKTELAQLRAHLALLISRLATTADPDQLSILHRSIDICTIFIARLTRIHLISNPADARQQQAIANMSRLMRQVLSLPETDDPASPPADDVLPASGDENEIFVR